MVFIWATPLQFGLDDSRLNALEYSPLTVFTGSLCPSRNAKFIDENNVQTVAGVSRSLSSHCDLLHNI